MKVMGILCMMLGVAALSLEFNRLRWCSIPATATIIEVNRQPAAKGDILTIRFLNSASMGE